jgi:serine/threonine-protein kinase HipA
MKKLNVFYNGWGERWQIGTLADSGKQIYFEFDDACLQKGIQISPLVLPLQKKVFTHFPDHQFQLPGFIADALPDGWGLLLLDRLFQKNKIPLHSISILDKLALRTDNAIGALTFEPSRDLENDSLIHSKSNSQNNFDFDLIAHEIRKLEADKQSKSLNELVKMGGSPHGARPKILIPFDSKTKKSQPWLFKFPSHNEHPEVCAIESVFFQLAKKAGLIVTESVFLELQETTAFGVQRFDRKSNQRIHIHTLAGALNANFRIPGSLSYQSFLQATRQITRDEREVKKAFHSGVFNFIFNNRDDHAKNFCYLMNANQQYILSPSYDLTYCEGPSGEHQMDYMGEGKNPNGSHLKALAESQDISKKDQKLIFDQVCNATESFSGLAKNYPIRKKTIEQIQKRIQSHIQSLQED